MASRADRSFLPASEISKRLGVSAHYLPKVLQDLTRAGITRSSRGPNGGVALRRAPADITLNEIIAAVDGAPDPAECPLAIDDCNCSPSDPCDFCRRLRAAQNQFTGLFDETTLADVRLCSGLLDRDAERIDVAPRQPTPARSRQ